ncbi:MAG: T9SS type A sorting domain-containing protein, partial [Bacteroidetes bacterium]|nr:T9SS type A sorting domain-containing protein [Bacteroidota bacterium]
SSYLETGCYDFTGGGRHLVAFSFWMQTVTGEDGLNLQFSLDEGESWHLLDSNELGYNWDWFTDTVDALDEIGWSGDNGGWQTVRQLLPDSFNTEPKVKFRFHFKSKATSVTDNGVGIDNFRVYAAPKDIGVASVDSITDNCQYINPDQIWVTVQNYGLNKLEDGESIPVGYSINGPDSYSASDVDTIDLEADLLPGGKITYQFTSPVDISTPGNYSVKAYTMYEADPMFYFSNNDTSDLDFEILANPITELQDTIQSKEPDTVVIRPKKDINYKYEWPPYPNVEDTFLVPSDGVYYVHVTDTGGNGCKTIDSVFVELLFNDAGIDSLISPFTSCELGDSEILTVSLYNFGTDSLLSGEPVDIWFEMDDGPPQEQSFNLPEVIHRQSSYSFDMTNYPLDLSTPGTYKFRMYTDIGGDTIASNDTTISYVTVHGYPDLDIGEDKTLEAYNYTLQAQSGYDQYLWDDGSTADSLVVDTSNWGNHWVTVTDTNNCASSDTAYVRLIVRDIIPKEIISPVSGCEIPGETTVTMKLENIGNDTIITDQQLYVSYRLNAGIRHIDTITLSGNLYPTAQYEHHFQVKGDFSIPDDYSFNVTATSYNDLTTSNDTINQLIVIDNNPDIDFGEDTNVFAYEYPLEATENANWNYVWKNDNGDELQNGPEHTYTARVSDQYHVIATDNSSGCSGGDTIQVTIKTRDLVAEGNNIPLVLCQGRSITPQLYVRQNGNFTLLSGSYIITYGIEEQSSFVDTATINNFAQGTVDTVTLKKSLVFDQTGSKSTFFDIDYEGDMNDTNDIHNKDIFVNTSPVVTLANGADTLTQELPVVLDAGSFEAYEWQDNSTNRTLNVTQPGDYSVTVTSNNGCQASDAIYVDALTSVSYASENLDEVSIYPVPASGTLTIKLSIRESMQPKAEIYDLRGKLLLRKELGDGNEIEKQLQLDELETGVYNLRIVDNQLLYQTNIIIAK